ncbi:hypothetical protein ACJX0J_033099 [Zea mays]
MHYLTNKSPKVYYIILDFLVATTIYLRRGPQKVRNMCQRENDDTNTTTSLSPEATTSLRKIFVFFYACPFESKFTLYAHIYYIRKKKIKGKKVFVHVCILLFA